MEIGNNDFSVIIPTLYEAHNIPELIHKISKINFGERKFEVILVDDNSQDGIDLIVAQLAKSYPWLYVLVRKSKRNLSQSILDGFQHAKYPILITLDADLSHPPDKIPSLLEALTAKVDMVIGSRYVTGGSTDAKWPLLRQITSRLAALLARIVLANNVRDPLSGFLAIRKSTWLAGKPCQPIGWKIGLEIMIKCHCQTICEIPIHFSQRKKGKSKLNLQIAFSYLQHLVRLTFFRVLNRSV